MMIDERLKNVIAEAAAEFGADESLVHIEHPADLLHGDYATNIAMVLAQKKGEKPRELAEKIAEKLRKEKGTEIKEVDVAGPGFINIYLSEQFFNEHLEEILKEKESYGKNATLKNKKAIIEYTDPNPFKEFHIGHLMSNTIGESLSRLLEFSGAEVRRANYQGDVGLHVAKAIWGLMNKKKRTNLDIKTLGEAYALGAEMYEENEKAKKEITEINKKVYEESDEEVNKLYKEGRAVSLAHFEDMYRHLGTTFDDYYFESTTASVGKKLVGDNTGEIFKESEGAIVFPAEEYNEKLHTRVFINREGLPTYEAKDLALAKIKHDTYPYDMSFIVTGNEVTEYFKVIRTALAQIFPELAARTTHVPHGILRLPSGKMSSRTGTVLTAEEMLEDARKEVEKKMEEANISKEETKMISDVVAVGAVKYSILHQALGKDIIFDFDTSLSFEGNSGPYLQYTYARCRSVLENTKESPAVTNREEPGEVERLLYRFPEVVKKASSEREPHHVAVYLFSLASAFNTYYAHNKIIGSDNESYRLALTSAVSHILQNGLWLLGITAPERM